MNIMEYEEPMIPNYELEIWEKGRCPSLGRIHRAGGDIVFDNSGCTSIDTWLQSPRMKQKIELLRKIMEAKMWANDYLIDDHHLSLERKKLWIREGRILFLPGKETEDFFSRLCGLCREADPKLAEMLYEENEKKAFSAQSLLRTLRSWELEL